MGIEPPTSREGGISYLRSSFSLLSLNLYLLFVLPDPATAAASQANKEEVDSRSVFVGNVSSFFP